MDPLSPAELIAQMADARARTLTLVEGLDAAQLMGPQLAIVNPLRWEIGHAPYFYEYWVLRRHLGEAAGRPDVDGLYASVAVAASSRRRFLSARGPRSVPVIQDGWLRWAQVR